MKKKMNRKSYEVGKRKKNIYIYICEKMMIMIFLCQNYYKNMSPFYYVIYSTFPQHFELNGNGSIE
jgi:hypothetical protein